MLSHFEPSRPMSIGVATACAILRDATIRLDAIRLEAEAEILEHARSRNEIEALISRLIDGLDEIDAPDEDLDFDEEIDWLDLGEHVDVAHGWTSLERASAAVAHRRASPLAVALAMAPDGRARA